MASIFVSVVAIVAFIYYFIEDHKHKADSQE